MKFLRVKCGFNLLGISHCADPNIMRWNDELFEFSTINLKSHLWHIVSKSLLLNSKFIIRRWGRGTLRNPLFIAPFTVAGT